MREAERAATYDAHRDDSQEFIEIMGTPAERGPVSLTVTVRFAAPEAEALQHAAQVEGKTFSAIVREAVRRSTQPAVPVAQTPVAHAHSLPPNTTRTEVSATTPPA